MRPYLALPQIIFPSYSDVECSMDCLGRCGGDDDDDDDDEY